MVKRLMEAGLASQNKSGPSRKKAGGPLYKPNPKRQLLLAAIALAAVLGGFFIGRLFNDAPEPPIKRSAPVPSPVVKAPEPWYQDQPPPPQMIGVDSAPSHLYEEALPGDIYEPPLRLAIPPELLTPLPAEEVAPPDWLKFSVADPALGRTPVIALVIDDMGIDRRRSNRVVELPAPLTLSFLPYALKIEETTSAAKLAGHELMVHVSMEPSSDTVDPGPNVLETGMSDEELLKRLNWALSHFSGFVGINNHMGSRFTKDLTGMSVVMKELKRRGLLYLDSRTTGGTVGPELAASLGVPFAERNVFLDNMNEESAVTQQLEQLEQTALKNGWAIGIGHPKDATISALKMWIPSLAEKNITLVPLTAIVKHRIKLAESN